MVAPFIKSIPNSRKDISEYLIDNPVKIEENSEINFSNSLLKEYNDLVGWRNEVIHPIFPYAIITHLHYRLVNNISFPFSPYGLLHKKEEIILFKNLKKGNWKFKSSIIKYQKVNSGIEFDMISDLYIDNQLSWRSTTTALKKLRKNIKKEQIEIEKLNIIKEISLSKGMALKYAWISKNIDPIHISSFLAKLMGHKGSLMHGMWGLARVLSCMDFPFDKPLEVICRFVSPMYLPCKAEIGIAKNETGSDFCLYSGKNQKPFFIGSYSLFKN
jgi:hypothetical protein